MRKLYYFVPICPACASRRTGRYVLPPIRLKHYMMIQSYKNGEIIKFLSPIPLENAFCLDCGERFAANISTKWLNEEEIETEIEKRGTDELLDEYIEKNHINLNKKPIFGSIFSGLTDF